MRKLAVAVGFMMLAGLSQAGVLISGSFPNTLSDGVAATTTTPAVPSTPFTPAPGDFINVSKNGGAAVTYTVTAAQIAATKWSFADALDSHCAKDSWTATYTSIASGLTSAPSNPVTTTISATGCAVNFTNGLGTVQ